MFENNEKLIFKGYETKIINKKGFENYTPHIEQSSYNTPEELYGENMP